MATYSVTAPDGTRFRVTAPDDATPDQVQAFAEQQFASMQAPAQANAGSGEAPAKPIGPMDTLRTAGRQLRDIAAGAIRGAGSIGSTLMAPHDYLNDLAMGDRRQTMSGLVTGQKPMSRNEERRAALDPALAELTGADTSSIPYAGGRLGAEVAGTLGAGGAVGNVVGRVAPRLGAAISSGGMATGSVPVGMAARAADLGVRSAGGAIGGGVSAGMVNPNEIGTGAAVGGALPVVGKVVQGGAGVARQMLGATTGVGDAAISQAVRAGREGGKMAQQFTDAMRGQSSMDDVLTAAKSNLDVMRQSKQAAYRSGMEDISKDMTMLDFGGIDKALTDAAKQVTYRGVSGTAAPQVKSQSAALAIAKMSDEVAAWRKLDPAEFHTPEGFDALKQKLGDILESIPFEDKTARLAAGKIYNAAKDSIQAQAPTYAKVMGDYSKASGTISEIEKALSLNPRASVDTQMRKLQSLMRNNVNTSYGYRDQLANLMIDQGGNDFMPALAGQAMNSWVPRGIQRATAGGGAATLGMLGNIPAAAGLAAVSSPRLVGESAYLMGRTLSPLEKLMGPAVRSAPVLAADRNQ